LVSSLLVSMGQAMPHRRHMDETGLLQMSGGGACNAHMSKNDCAVAIAGQIVSNSRACFAQNSDDQVSYKGCVQQFCGKQCGKHGTDCNELCQSHALPLFDRLTAAEAKKLAVAVAAVAAPATQDVKPAAAQDVKPADDDTAHMNHAQLEERSKALEHEQGDAMGELQAAQQKMVDLNGRIKARAEKEIQTGDKAKGEAEMAKVKELDGMQQQISGHLANVQAFTTVAQREMHQSGMGLVQKTAKAGTSFLQVRQAPEDELAKEMTHDLEMNFNKIAPFGKEDTAKELQDHAAKTQDTLVDAVENAEVAEIKRAVFRALTRLRAATIKEFDTIARLETQAIDAYNDAHHYRAENPLAHLHEDEAPVETDKLKSFH